MALGPALPLMTVRLGAVGVALAAGDLLVLSTVRPLHRAEADRRRHDA
jgi:hypothetical protein